MSENNINDVNTFISNIDNKEEANFYLEICDYFDHKKLRDVFHLSELISSYRESLSILKSEGDNYTQKCIFIKNIVEEMQFNDIQKYNFYLLLHIFIENLLFDVNILNGIDNYISWLEDQLDAVSETATLYYYDFNILVLMSEISYLSSEKQIKILRRRKKEYFIKVSTNEIPKKNFDLDCDEQIRILAELIEQNPHQMSLTIEKMTDDEVKMKSVREVADSEYKKPKLTLPDILKEKEYGGVHYASEKTKYSIYHIRHLAQNRKIPCHKPTKTGHWRFFGNELDEWLKNGMINFEKSDDKLLRRKK